MIKVLFFASLRERMKVDEIDVPAQGLSNASDVMKHIMSMSEHYRETLSSPQPLVAVNQEMAQGDTHIKDGDEIAFYPPVTGG